MVEPSAEDRGLEQDRRPTPQIVVIEPEKHGRDFDLADLGEIYPPRVDPGLGRDAAAPRHLIDPCLQRFDFDRRVPRQRVMAELPAASVQLLKLGVELVEPRDLRKADDVVVVGQVPESLVRPPRYT